MNITKPILRWAGGKSWLLQDIHKYLPNDFNNYHEPFIGGGSVFIYLKSTGIIQNKAYLSDLNESLINSYKIIKSFPEELISHLKKYENTSDAYYRLRDVVTENNIEKAAIFIYLNRTSFNGIYRVNLKGKYNVPFGNRNLMQLFDYENILKCSDTYVNAFFSANDFLKSLSKAQEYDLVFLDPPYTIAHENNGFIKYNQKIFAWEDQIRLKKAIEELNDKNVHFILTNAAHSSIDKLYDGIGNKKILKRYSLIGGKGAKRSLYNEYLYYKNQNGL